MMLDWWRIDFCLMRGKTSTTRRKPSTRSEAEGEKEQNEIDELFGPKPQSEPQQPGPACQR